MKFISDTHFCNCLCFYSSYVPCFNSFAEATFIIPRRQLHCTRHSSHSFELYTYISPTLFFNALSPLWSLAGMDFLDRREGFLVMQKNCTYEYDYHVYQYSLSVCLSMLFTEYTMDMKSFNHYYTLQIYSYSEVCLTVFIARTLPSYRLKLQTFL